ncbi:MAG: nucleotidyltransferase domain-containing protein, partial [Proteobacteria bacterium]|nr:nucleotidyltransferase domain-containing protein [Pseudomonadota bacterium]
NKQTLSRSGPSMTDALFSSTQQRVLGLIFGQPERSFFATEVIARVGAGSGAVQRELKKLADSGLVTVSRIGNQKHFQANASSPIFEELCALVRKTVGLAEPLRQALAPAVAYIDLALVYGSVAKRSATASSDIDMLVVSDALTLEALFRLLQPAEEELGRAINPTLYNKEEFQRRLDERSPFLERVLSSDTLILHGGLPNEFQKSGET